MKSIKISDEDKQLIEKMAEKDHCFEQHILSTAIRNLAKAKKIIENDDNLTRPSQ